MPTQNKKHIKIFENWVNGNKEDACAQLKKLNKTNLLRLMFWIESEEAYLTEQTQKEFKEFIFKTFFS